MKKKFQIKKGDEVLKEVEVDCDKQVDLGDPISEEEWERRMMKMVNDSIINLPLKKWESNGGMGMDIKGIREAFEQYQEWFIKHYVEEQEIFWRVIEDMERASFTFHKRDTEVWFEKLIDRPPDKDGMIEPYIFKGHADIEPPYKLGQWIPATIEAAKRALDEWERVCPQPKTDMHNET